MAEQALALELAPPETSRKISKECITQIKSHVIPDSFAERSDLLVNTTLPDLQECTNKIISLQILQSQETPLSPFQKLPTEIIVVIFILATTSDRGMICLSPIYDARGGIRRFQCSWEIFPVSWVCSEWRQIILSTPSFWTSYQFKETEVFLSHHSNIDAYISMNIFLNELLLRSGTAASLCLHLAFGPGCIGSTYSVPDALIQRTSRWKEVTLEFWDPIQSTLHYIHERTASFPNLEVLLVDSMKHDSKLGSLAKTFIHFARLHYLDTTASHPRETFDLQHLTTLRFATSLGPSLAILLKRCPVLETLHLGFPEPDPVSDSQVIIPTSSTVHHLHLKNLTVKYLDYRSSITF